MYVWMMDERLTPGMEDGEEAEPGTEMFRVQGDLLKRLSNRAHQEIVKDLLVLKHERRETLWYREDHVRVGHRKHVGLARLEPRRLGAALAGSLLLSSRELPLQPPGNSTPVEFMAVGRQHLNAAVLIENLFCDLDVVS